MNCALERTLSNLVQKCTIQQLKQIHAFIITLSLHQNADFLSRLLRRSTEFGGMEYSNLIFTHLGTSLSTQTTLWNAMIRGYAYNGPLEMCVTMFNEMPLKGLKPNNFTYPYVLNSCSQLGWYRTGKRVHCHVVKSGFHGTFRVSESLFNMYMQMSASFDAIQGRSENFGDALKVFDELYIRTVELWNKIIYLYAQIGDVSRARQMFDIMPQRDIVSWNSMISGYAKVGDSLSARELFQQMPERNVVSWTSMIGAYANTGDVNAAREIFDQMPSRNVVSWNSMISCFSRNGEFEEVLHLFVQMQLQGINPDGFTFASALSACAHIGALEFGQWVNSLIKDWSQMSVIVGTSLLELHAKCGDVDKAFTIFIKIGNKDVFCWNVMIKSLAIHGRTEDALKLFSLMQSKGLKPNDFTFSSALFACSHGGLVEEGQRIFDGMEKHFGISRKLEHYGCMIDLLSRNDQLERAESLVKEMPFKPDNAIWGALLGGCSAISDIQLAKQVIKNTDLLDEKEPGVFVSLSNMYASMGQWTEASSTRRKMERKKITEGAMGKQKQQVISRFFAPKSNTPSASSPTSNEPSSSPLSENPPTPHPKISATATFSPAKRRKHLRTSQFLSPDKPSKTPKLSPHTHNPKPLLPNPSLHQKFLQKLLEPPEHLLEPAHEPLDSPIEPRVLNPKYTPLEQQVVELKNKYPDVLLMIEVGYKYRFFGKDAEIAARILGIYAHVDRNFLTASIPTFRRNVHVRRLVSQGYKVGVVKQTETAAIKAHGSNKVGPFCRGLSALYTKATIEAAEDLGGGEEGCGSLNNYLFCVVEGEVGVESGFDVRIGLVAVEISTGDVIYGEFNDNFIRDGLEAVILSLSPAELLVSEPLSKQTEKVLLAYAGPTSNVRMERILCNHFKDGGALADVISYFENIQQGDAWSNQHHTVEVAGDGNNQLAITVIMSMPGLAVLALAITLGHLKQFGFEGIVSLGASFRPLSSNMEMRLSANTLQQLEVLKNNSDGSEVGTLLKSMNHTLTVFGSRLLMNWVTHPLCDKNMITARLDAVTEIAESMGGSEGLESLGTLDAGILDFIVVQQGINHVVSSVLIALGRSSDIQRGITRIFHRTATPKEFIAVMQAILLAGKQLQQLKVDEDVCPKEARWNTVRSVLLRKLILIASSPSVINAAARLLSTLNAEAADKGDMLNLMIISDGEYPDVAECRTKAHSAKEKLESLIGLYRKQLGMRNLEYMSVSGTTHLIELPSDARVPTNWIKVNSTKKTIRYHPPEVLTALDQLSLASEELTVASRAAWNTFLGKFRLWYAEFQAAVQAFAALDCLHSLAILSRNKNYVRPVFVDDDQPVQIRISSGRHPVLENILQDNFVPNDTDLHAEREYCQIVTGPNMGGKSCYIRQVALIAIMAQVGSFVPALSARLHVLDGVHTRMGASDNIQQGRSTFLEELSEASQILQRCTSRSLVVLDELGRGTSTHDGVAIAYATLHHLLQQKRCLVLFVTHYPKIADLQKEFPGAVGTYHVSYVTSKKENKTEYEEHDDVTYLYKLVPGISERSFGFKVAQLAQLPASCIQRAIVMAEKLETAVVNRRMDDDQRRNSLLSGTQFPDADIDNEALNGIILNERDDTIRFSNTCRKFFWCLNSALANDHLAADESFEMLKHARTVARQELLRFSGSC
ncbi:Mismatch repair protein msh3 [Dionaea muscipula]